MTKGEMLLHYSRELRAWLYLSAPYLAAFVTGWHLPAPKYMQAKLVPDEAKEENREPTP